MEEATSRVKYTKDGIPYHTISDFFPVKMLIGENGGNSTVLTGYGTVADSERRRTVAIKMFTRMDKYSEKEIQLLKMHSHPNIIRLFGVIWDDQVDSNNEPVYTGYVMEYMELGSLHRVIHNPSETYDMELIKKWIRQIATGLQYLHDNGIIHRDVKPHNILLAARNHLKLADFGLARNIAGSQGYTSGMIGTDFYMAPEVIGIEKNYGPPADIYSFGVTIWEIATRQQPRGIFGMEDITDESMLQLITDCLQVDASDRPFIYEIIQSVTEYQTIFIVNGRDKAFMSANRFEWTQIQWSMPIVQGLIYLNNELYVVGGYDKSLHKLEKNMKWIRLADMNIVRFGITNSCLEWNGYIWVFGGHNLENKYCLKSVERYDPNEDKWTLMPDLIHPRRNAAATVWNDRIIVSGGQADIKALTSVECFNPEDDSWTELPNLPSSLSNHSLVSYNNKIILMGASAGTPQTKVYELNPLRKKPTWNPLPPTKYPVFFGIVLDDELYAIGGRGEQGSVAIFDGDHWRAGQPLPFCPARMAAVIIPQRLADHLYNKKPG